MNQLNQAQVVSSKEEKNPLLESFSAIKTESKLEVPKESSRKVRLVYESHCGCGKGDIEIIRVVPVDSPLQDGDKIETLEAGDQAHY